MEEKKFTEDVERQEGVKEMIERIREERMEEQRMEFEEMMNSKEANKFREVTNRKRKAKGPNPLSVLKKRPKTDGAAGNAEETKKRQRRRKSKSVSARSS